VTEYLTRSLCVGMVTWIGHQPRPATGTPADFLTGAESSREFSRCMFRRTFDVEVPPAEAPARISADSRYVLWVNGHEVGRGPARSQPYRQRYDSHDLSPYLTVGANAIAVLVTYYGLPMSFWQPAPAGSNTDAALVFEAQIGEAMLVVSDDSWRVQRSAAWGLLAGTHAGEGVPVELVDAREVRSGGAKSSSTTPTGDKHLRSRLFIPPVSVRPGHRPTPSAAFFREASPSLAAVALGQPACSIPPLVRPRSGGMITR
jgi:hypothetical protein